MKDLFANPAAAIVLGVVFVAFICFRQLRRRPVREDSGYRGPVIIGLIGVVESANVIAHVPAIEIVTTVLSFVIGAGFGVLRARFAHIWRDGGVLYRQGNAWTIVFWVVGIGAHVGLDALGGALAASATASSGTSLGSSTVLIYIAISLAVQNFVVLRRAARLAPFGAGSPAVP